MQRLKNMSTMETPPKRRTVMVRRKVIGPQPPRPMTALRKRKSDFPGVRQAHLDAAEALTSPLLIGPPLCDELVAFVQHLLTENEASVFRHLNGKRGRTAAAVAKAEHRPKDEVTTLLKRLTFEKLFTFSLGKGEKRRYRLIPIVPGIFERVLFGEALETMSPWHRRFAELFEALYDTGYIGDYQNITGKTIRFLPLAEVSSAHYAALPSDKLEVVFDRFDTFVIGNCQCRMSMQIVGKGCGRSLANCMAMGDYGKMMLKAGSGKEVSQKTALEIKLEAEKEGLVNWILNVESTNGQVCCACCGCCCHGMRAINEFNVPSMAAPPHFLPSFDRSKCTYCGKCAKACPLNAIVVDVGEKSAWQLQERCIGCGLCTRACNKEQAIAMEPVPDYRLPPDSWYAMIAGAAPNAARGALGAWLKRGRRSSWWRG